eukprot:jgi/Botrbrau1/7161/Bobra.0143s0032.2
MRSLWPRKGAALGFIGGCHGQTLCHNQVTVGKRLVMQVSGSSESPAQRGAFLNETISIAGATEGTLESLSFAVKDLYDVKGYVTGFGNPTWRSTHVPAAETAPAVQALLDAGANLEGKTVLDEFAYSLNGENKWYGTPENPACPDRIPGGSSSGSAVAVAAQLRDFALGSDTAGSVRIPASYCGTYGVRPTHGRVSLENACALAPSYDTGGWFATSANVLCKVGQVLLCPSTRKDVKFRRWLVAKDAFDTADSETSTALYNVVAAKLEVVKRLLGVPQEVVVADLPGLCGLQAWADVFRSNQTVEVWQTLGPWIQENDWPECAPAIKERLKFASTFPQSQVPESTKARERITQHMGELLRDDGLLMLPTAPGPAPERGAADADPELRFKVLRLTSIAGLAGLPQVILPWLPLSALVLPLTML